VLNCCTKDGESHGQRRFYLHPHGFPDSEPMNIAKTDGPVGVAVLAQTLRGMGLKPVFVMDDLCAKVASAVVPKTKVMKFPVDAEQASLLA